MVKCSKCKEEIEFLKHSQSGVDVWEFDGDNYEKDGFFPDGQVDEYECPECQETLFTKEDEARKFLLGK